MRGFIYRFFRSARGEWLLLAANLAVLAGVLAFSLYHERRTVEHSEEIRLGTQTKIIHDLLSSQFTSIHHAHQNLRRELRIAQVRGENPMPFVERRVQGFVEVIPGIRSMSLLDAGGTIIASSRPELVGKNFRERSYFQRPRKSPETDTLYLSPPYITALDIWSISLSSRVNGPRGEFAGVIVSTLNTEDLAQHLQSVLYAPDMWVRVSHGNGQLFLIFPEQPKQLGRNLAVPGSLFQRHEESGKDGSYLTGRTLTTGDERAVFARTLREADMHTDYAMQIAASRDTKQLYAPWWRSVWRQILLYALLAGSSAFGLYLSQRRRRQSRQLAIANERILRDKNHVLEKLNCQLQEQSAALEAMAFRDGLTGVANRRRFDEALAVEWRYCRRKAAPLAILMIDVDHFKPYNDRYGHQAGDDCLRAVAQALDRDPIRPHDLLARYGGEEFVCLLPDCDLAGAKAQAEELRQAVAALQLAHADSPTAPVVTVSIGVHACIPQRDDGADELLAAADQALYHAKQNGRNRVMSAPSGLASAAHSPAASLPC
jgi:diguanylate cyclase (GGDEF)-like protein